MEWRAGGGIDRRIEQSSEILHAYKAGIANPYYLSSNFNPVPHKAITKSM